MNIIFDTIIGRNIILSLILLGVLTACQSMQTDMRHKVYFHLPATSFVFNHVNNPIDLCVGGYKFSDLRLTMDSGVVLKNDSSFSIRPTKHKGGGKVYLKLFNGKNEIGAFSLTVKNASPVPGIQVNDFGDVTKSGFISKADLLRAGKVSVVDSDTDIDMKGNFDIVRCELIYGTFKGDSLVVLASIHMNGNNLTIDEIDVIENAEPNSVINFESIVVRVPDGTYRTLQPLKLRLFGD